MPDRARVVARKASGRCVECGAGDGRPLRGTKCVSCADKAMEKWARLRAQRKEKGLCSECGGSLGSRGVGGLLQCQGCTLRNAVRDVRTGRQRSRVF